MSAVFSFFAAVAPCHMVQTVRGSLIYVFFGVVWGLMRLMTGRKRTVLSLEGCDVGV